MSTLDLIKEKSGVTILGPDNNNYHSVLAFQEKHRRMLLVLFYNPKINELYFREVDQKQVGKDYKFYVKDEETDSTAKRKIITMIISDKEYIVIEQLSILLKRLE